MTAAILLFAFLSMALADVPRGRTALRRLQEAIPPPTDEGIQWTAPAQQPQAPPPATAPPAAAPAPVPQAVPAPVPVGVPSPSPSPLPTLPVVAGPLEHMALDCWNPCGGKGGYCSWCGSGNSCCRRGANTDPPECGTASVFVTLHHECVQTRPPAPTAVPVVTAAPVTQAPAVEGPPTAAPQQLVPAGQVPTAAPPATAVTYPPSVAPTVGPTAPTTLSPTAQAERYLDRRDRFIRASTNTWFQDAQQPYVKHLVRTGCQACGTPPPCENNVLVVSQPYLDNLTMGEDFKCEMLADASIHGINAPPFPTSTSAPMAVITYTSTTTTTAEAAAGGWPWTTILCVTLLLCCCAGSAAALFAMNHKGNRKASAAAKKNKKLRGGSPLRSEASSNGEDREPLVQAQENGQNQSFGGGDLDHRARMAAMAPTYTAMNPQMAQGAMAAQMGQMNPQVPMTEQAFMANLQTQQMQQGMPMPATWQGGLPQPAWQGGLPTQAAFGQGGEQEMELVTVTPNGLAVTPLAPGQQVPPGVPVLQGGMAN